MNTRRLRGLTAADTVVLSVVLVFLLFGVLMPMLARAQGETLKDICGMRLANIGKAMLIYANDYGDYLPRAGGCDSNWAPVVWNALTRKQAYGTTDTNRPPPWCPGCFTPDPNGFVAMGGNCTISSCFYLLVKYSETDPNQFVCPQDPNVSVFTLAAEDPNLNGIAELTQAWDFGSKPQTHCSYTYQAPWSTYALKTSDDPNFAFVADRNPWLDSPGAKAKPFPAGVINGQVVVFNGKHGSNASQQYGNSSVHNEDGQNVLFLDAHVTFETRAYCGLQDDNIYTISALVSMGDPLGRAPACAPHLWQTNGKDSLLVHDPPTWPTSAGQK